MATTADPSGDDTNPSPFTLKKRLLEMPVIAVLEQLWVDITPDGTATVHMKPEEPVLKAWLKNNERDRPEVVVECVCPAIVYFNGTVYVANQPKVLFTKDVIGGWNDIIIGFGN